MLRCGFSTLTFCESCIKNVAASYTDVVIRIKKTIKEKKK